MRKRKVYSEQKKYINNLIDILENNDSYKVFCEKNERYKKIIEEANQLFYWGVTFFDVYDNKQMNKLVKKISKLDPKLYKVDLYLRPKKIKNLNYFKLQYDYSSSGLLARVKPNNDEFVRDITATYSQINNNQAIVVFEMYFKKPMNFNSLFAFVKSHKEKNYKKQFVNYYNLERLINSQDYSFIHEMFYQLAKSTFQARLMDIAELNIGKEYRLPSCVVISYQPGVYDKDTFRNLFLKETIEIRNGEQYLVIDVTGREGTEMELYFEGNAYRPIPFSDIIREYRMKFYYFLFDEIESNELNKKMNKYFNESKNRISTKDYKWLVNKIRVINDNKLHMKNEKKYGKEHLQWRSFYNGKEREVAFFNDSYTEKFQTIYSECLEHIKIINSLQKESLVIKIASWTLFATLIGIVVTVILGIK